MINEKDNLLLGKTTNYNIDYDVDVLDIIKRKKKQLVQMYGVDFWNCYDFMYLDSNKGPKAGILSISINSESKCIIESKSMKLYLGSFYKKKFLNKKECCNKIKADIKSKLNLEVDVKIQTVTKSISFNDNDSICLESNKEILNTHKKLIKIHTNCFRSLCPVTGQPDFASIYIEYQGSKIKVAEIKEYLYGFSEKTGFHEACVEEIYKYIFNTNRVKELTVFGFFNRRGGIDINPVRTSIPNKKLYFERKFRQ